jgi:hypothetical protein
LGCHLRPICGERNSVSDVDLFDGQGGAVVRHTGGSTEWLADWHEASRAQ